MTGNERQWRPVPRIHHKYHHQALFPAQSMEKVTPPAKAPFRIPLTLCKNTLEAMQHLLVPKITHHTHTGPLLGQAGDRVNLFRWNFTSGDAFSNLLPRLEMQEPPDTQMEKEC